MEIKYFECHITIEPVFEERLTLFKEISNKYNFKVADLLFQKRKEDNPTRSSKDSFCTGRDKSYEVIKQKMDDLIQELKNNQFKVWRQKIEAVIYDERTKQT